ncbi:MAG: aminoacyl-tRNA hydrolase, partial [Eubacterium sp.]|nr:aminoacyl-tRNA hydrolase [Eubacterium sp.]
MNTNKIFAGAFRLFRRCKVKKNKITLIEKLDTGGTGSLYAIRKECIRRGLDYDFHVITHKDYEVRLSNLLGLIRLFTAKVYHLATSAYVFLNDNFIPMAYMDFDRSVTIVQLWHGMGSYKKFAGSSEKDPEMLALIRDTNRQVTCILASSEKIRDNYAEAFCVPKEKVQALACPQADYYFTPHPVEEWKEKLCEKYPGMRGKKWILYAPTFRDDKDRDYHLLDQFDFKRFREELGEEYCLMVRLHPQIHSGRVPDYVIDMTGYPNIRKLLCMTDILITDYSSVTVEYALLNRPVFLYAFDQDWYIRQDRGFYFDFEETAPGPIAHTMDDLIRLIRDQAWDPDRVQAFARLHNDFFDNRSAARLVDYFLDRQGEPASRDVCKPSADTACKQGEEKMKIVIGLGNPTDRYKGTRHNVGYMALDRIAEEHKIKVNQHRHKALVGTGFIGSQKVLLVKPLTYMNLSGECVRAVWDYYKPEPEDLLIIYDDISLDPGSIRIRKKGSAGGHNGMKSIIRHLGFDDFPRIRVGIGGEKHPDMDLADYVLGHFNKEEMAVIDQALDKVCKAA